MNCISECVLNVLSRNIALKGCEKRKLSKHNLVDRQVTLPGKKRLIVQSRSFLLPLLAAVLQRLLVSLKPSNTIHVTYYVHRPGRGLPLPIICGTPKRETVREVDDDVYDDEFLEEDAKSFCREIPNAFCPQEAVSRHNTVYVNTVIYLRLAISR